MLFGEYMCMLIIKAVYLPNDYSSLFKSTKDPYLDISSIWEIRACSDDNYMLQQYVWKCSQLPSVSVYNN